MDAKFGKLCIWMVSGMLFLTLSCAYQQKSEFAQRREQWASQKITDYRYTFKVFSFSPDAGKPLMIEVREGKQVSLKCIECQLQRTQVYTNLDTIEKIFDVIQKEIEGDRYSFDVKYDETFGHPIFYRAKNKDSGIMDDWWRFEISNFEVIK
jgi:hypothetical protein